MGKYYGENILSPINGVGKTEQLHAQESNWTICSHYIKNKLQMD